MTSAAIGWAPAVRSTLPDRKVMTQILRDAAARQRVDLCDDWQRSIHARWSQTPISLFGWRRQALAKGLITDNRSVPSVAPALTFSPVEVAEEPAIADARGEVRPARRRKADPHCGHLFVFRGRRGDLIKVIWHDGQGACLFSKRLERGRFIWPTPAEGAVTISRAQLGYLLEGIDWRAPQHTWRPELAG